MKKLFLMLFVLLTSVSLVSCGANEEEYTVTREEQFIVGMECNYAPFNWTENTKTPYNYPIANFEGKFADGYDVQIAKAIATVLGKVLVIQKLDWDALIPQLESGKIDAIIAGMSPTEERKQSVAFTESYYTSTHVILLPKTSSFANAKTLNDFSGARVVGQHGTIYDDLIPQLTGATHQTPLKTIPDILTAILSNKSDCTILEKPVATGIVAGQPDLTFIELEDVFEVSEEDIVVSVAVRLNETTLVSQINEILFGISENARLALMEQAVNRAN